MASVLSFTDPKPQLCHPQQIQPGLTPAKCINTCQRSALLIENDESLSNFFTRALKNEGYTVRTASNSNEGLRLYSDCAPFSVVLIDYAMPETSGIELGLAIRKIDPSQGIIMAAFDYANSNEVPMPPELVDVRLLIDGNILHLQLRNALKKLEVDRAIEALTPPELLQLQRFAAFRVRGLGRAARGRNEEDLLGEALLRTLIGAESIEGRHWNRNVDFVQHLTGAMRSISSSWKRQAGENEAYCASEVLVINGAGQKISPLESVPSGEAAPDRRLVAEEEVAKIFSLFREDKEATQVLQGWFDDLKRNEIMQKYGLDENQWGAAVKRIRVKVSRENCVGGGEQHEI